MLRFGTAIARLRAHQLDAYEGRACKEANLARGRQPVPIVDVDRCLHEKAFIAWFMAEEIQSGDQPLRAATVLWFRPPPLNRDSIRSCEVEMAPRGIFDPRRRQNVLHAGSMQLPLSGRLLPPIFTDGRRCKTHASRLCAPRTVGSGWRSAHG
jgi:hypothetical protein